MGPVGLSSDSPLVKFMGWDGELHYPSDNGELMSNDTLHFEWILFIYEAIREAFRNREDVFTACDLLWYPVEGRPDISRAPDTMVVFGRPKGHRPCWKQWEEGGTGPQFVVEVVSRSNTEEEFQEKIAFYGQYGSLECLIYDFTRKKLSVWSRESPEAPLNLACRNESWSSPLLGMTFRLEADGRLEIRLPDGRPARSRDQLFQDWEDQRELADAERERADAERERAEVEQQRADAERERAEHLAAKLRALGIDPESL
jgi:Uma2 family endonuclease